MCYYVLQFVIIFQVKKTCSVVRDGRIVFFSRFIVEEPSNRNYILSVTPEKLNRSLGSSHAALLRGYVMCVRGEYCNKNVNSNEKPA